MSEESWLNKDIDGKALNEWRIIIKNKSTVIKKKTPNYQMV